MGLTAIVLGAAAGGGFPQWNCNCDVCRLAWAGDKRVRARTQASFAVADKHLSTRAFMLGDRPTIVDFSMAGYVFYPAEGTGFDITTEFPALHAWRQRLAALPGWKPPYEMMPVGSDLRLGMRRPA